MFRMSHSPKMFSGYLLNIYQFIVGAVYIPPQNSENSNVNTFDDITDDVSYIISQYSTGDGILLIGDLMHAQGA